MGDTLDSPGNQPGRPVVTSEALDPTRPTPRVFKGRMGRYKNLKPSARPKSPTPLRDWLDAHDMTLQHLAGIVKCSKRALQLWADGQALPSLVYAYRLDEATGGAIPPASWLGTHLGRESWIACGGRCE